MEESLNVGGKWAIPFDKNRSIKGRKFWYLDVEDSVVDVEHKDSGWEADILIDGLWQGGATHPEKDQFLQALREEMEERRFATSAQTTTAPAQP